MKCIHFEHFMKHFELFLGFFFFAVFHKFISFCSYFIYCTLNVILVLLLVFFFGLMHSTEKVCMKEHISLLAIPPFLSRMKLGQVLDQLQLIGPRNHTIAILRFHNLLTIFDNSRVIWVAHVVALAKSRELNYSSQHYEDLDSRD